MKLAIISNNDYIDKKGAFNATHNRIKYLRNKYSLELDVFLLLEYESFLIRKLRKTSKRMKFKFVEYDGIKYNILWSKFSLFEYIFRVKLHKYPSFFHNKYTKYRKIFSIYDHISAHSTIPGLLALEIKKNYSIPYSITWHGSDIHSEPQYNSDINRVVYRLILNAKNNYFVSQNLLDISPNINNISKQVLYNGVDKNIYFKKTKDEINNIKYRYGIISNKNVAYIGGLVNVKNATLLPIIFNEISKKVSNIQFHIIGDGGLRSIIKQECTKLNLNVEFYGNRPPYEIPDLINCMDLIILPSKNEGLPLIALESLACGVPVIGSDVGGIPEAIGVDNVVPLDVNFTANFSELALKRLLKPIEIHLDEKFSWELTAEKEYESLSRLSNYKSENI